MLENIDDKHFDVHANKDSISAMRISQISDELQEIYDELIRNGDDVHEITAITLQDAIKSLREVYRLMS